VAAAEKIPLNPYYMIVWYVLFLFGVATVVINLSAQSLASIYHLCQWLGLEEALLLINRPYRIHEFLLARDNADRWQRIAVYFSIMHLVLLPFSLCNYLIAKRYNHYLSKNLPAWSVPFDAKMERSMRSLLALSLFFICAYIFLFCRGYGNLSEVPKSATAIQLLNTSFYSEAINVGFFCFGLALLQYHGARVRHMRSLHRR